MLHRTLTLRGVLAGFELRQPGIGFLKRQMQARLLIFVPHPYGVLAECLALFLTFDILCDGFAHDPMRAASTHFGQVLDAPLTGVIEYDCCWRHHSATSVAPGIPCAKLPYLGCADQF